MFRQTRPAIALVFLLSALSVPAIGQTAAQPAVGVRGHVGHLQNPKRVRRLQITEPGVYENYLVDGGFLARNLVKINADGVTLRNCEIRNGGHNAVTVYAKNVLIENCKIHHFLAGTFEEQRDAHGITGQPHNLVVRNCEIYYFSGDALQFDPDRQPWDNVLVENCTLWTGPLPQNAAGFHRGERPGENAVDTKNNEANLRARMAIRNCLMYGFGDGQIVNQAALNLKNHVQVAVTGCVLADNDICFRLRGDTGSRGGALVSIRDCAIYRSKIGLRMEDAIENLRVIHLGVARDVQRPYTTAEGDPRNYVNQGQFVPPPIEEVIREGVPGSSPRERRGASSAKRR